jgi:hypothetical protein
MDPALSEIKHALRSLKARQTFVELRIKLAGIDASEKIYHEIELLKAEKHLAMLLRQNIVAIATSPDQELRSILESFKTGAVTGLVASKDLRWEDLFAHVDYSIEALEEKLQLVKIKEEELNKLLRE